MGHAFAKAQQEMITKFKPITPHYANVANTMSLSDLPHEVFLENLKPIYMQLSMKERAAIINQLTEEQFQAFFPTLPAEEQVKMAEYINQLNKAQEEKSFQDCKKLMDLQSEGDLMCILLTILIQPLSEKLFKKVEYQKLLTKNEFRFKLPRHFKDIKKQFDKLQPWCLKKEGGCISQLMTAAIPHWWRDYEGIGNFFFIMQKEYPGIMHKFMDKAYIDIRKTLSRSMDEYGDILTTALLINLLCQVGINKIKEVNAQTKEIRNEDETLEKLKNARRRGVNVRIPKYTHLEDEPLRNIAYDCEQIGLILSKEYPAIFKSKKMFSLYTSIDSKINDIDTYYYAMDKAVVDCIKEYTYFYLAKMVLVARNNEGMPEGVKNDIKFLFQSDFGYCRLMKDIRGIAEMTTEDDPMDVADEIKDILKSNEKKFPTIRYTTQRVIAMRSSDFQYDEKFMKKIHDQSVAQVKSKRK